MILGENNISTHALAECIVYQWLRYWEQSTNSTQSGSKLKWQCSQNSKNIFMWGYKRLSCQRNTKKKKKCWWYQKTDLKLYHIDKDKIILATKTDKQNREHKRGPRIENTAVKIQYFEKGYQQYILEKKSIFNKWLLENEIYVCQKNEIISIFLNSKQTRLLYISWNIETCSWPWEAIWISGRKRVEYIWSLEDVKKCRQGQERDGR